MLKKEIIEKISTLTKQLTKIQRDERRAKVKTLSQQQIQNQKEYDRRISEGQAVEPLVKIEDLEGLVGSEAN